MVDRTNENLAEFVNSTIRPLCEVIGGLLQAILIASPQYVAEFQTVVNSWDPDDRIMDGSESDGRMTLTQAELKLIIALLVTINSATSGSTLTAVTRALSRTRNPLSIS